MFNLSAPRVSVRRQHRAVRSAVVLTTAAVTMSLALAGCTPGSATTSPEGDGSVSADLGTEPITLTVETQSSPSDVASVEKLGEAFSAKYPNVTVEVIEEDFVALQQNGPRIISTDDAPDLIRFPTLGNAVKDDLLTNLDPYAELYGWDDFPATQLDQWRVSDDGSLRGDGSLYGMGLSFSLVGVYYNKEKAEALGMTTPPETLEEFQALLDAAKAAGELPMLTNAKDGGSFLPYQALLLALGQRQAVTDWTLNVPDSSIDSPEAVEAAAILQEWATGGYLPEDVNALGNEDVVSRFTSGTGVFWINGNWNAATLNDAMGDNVGFFLLPPADGNPYASMSDPINFVIPAKAKHHDAAAAFLNFAYSDEGRQIMVDTTGQVPGGPADAATPTAPDGSVVADTLTAFQILNENNGITPYIGNATSSIYTDTLIPQLQVLLANKITPEDFVKILQSDYESQLQG